MMISVGLLSANGKYVTFLQPDWTKHGISHTTLYIVYIGINTFSNHYWRFFYSCNTFTNGFYSFYECCVVIGVVSYTQPNHIKRERNKGKRANNSKMDRKKYTVKLWIEKSSLNKKKKRRKKASTVELKSMRETMQGYEHWMLLKWFVVG